MLLIWTVYRVWGMRSWAGKQGGQDRAEDAPRGSQHPHFCNIRPLTLESPYPKSSGGRGVVPDPPRASKAVRL